MFSILAVISSIDVGAEPTSRYTLLATRFELKENTPTHSKKLNDSCTSGSVAAGAKLPFDECMKSSISIIAGNDSRLELEVGANNQALFCKNSRCVCLEVDGYTSVSSSLYKSRKDAGNTSAADKMEDLACFLTGLKGGAECISQKECAKGFHCYFNGDGSIGSNKLGNLENIRRFCTSWSPATTALIPMILVLVLVAVLSA